MTGSFARSTGTVLILLATADCGGGMPRTAAQPAVPAAPSAARPAAPPAASSGYTGADVYFLSGMIPHHAQAVLIAGWAPTHGAGEVVRRLCARIVVSQRDEIAIMRSWLQRHGQPLPDSTATSMTMRMGGIVHDMPMPGMLSRDDLAQLDAASGTEFDRLFLTFMIRHHQGALTMVEDLIGSYGAAQDPMIFKLASDIQADQSVEIDRMQRMLAALR